MNKTKDELLFRAIESVQPLDLTFRGKTIVIDSSRLTLHEGKTISAHNSDLFIPSFRQELSYFNLWLLHELSEALAHSQATETERHAG